MIATVEVRWFRPGLIDPEVGDWFAALPGPAAREPERTDNYLKIPDETKLGIKIRSGRIEIKQRAVSHGLVLFQQGVVGKVAGWRKWGFGLADVWEELPMVAEDLSGWIPVTKERRLRRLRLPEAGHCEPVSPEVMVSHGCDLELTQIRLGSSRWWTVAMEAYGPEIQRYENLTRTASRLFEAPFPALLHERDSMSYPAWLQFYSSLGTK